jgi:hypothetical protein
MRAEALGSDGCTGVPDWYLDACLEHDGHYATHVWCAYTDEEGAFHPSYAISRETADLRFRHVIQTMSRFGRWSPLSWWRYAAVRVFGRKLW